MRAYQPRGYSEPGWLNHPTVAGAFIHTHFERVTKTTAPTTPGQGKLLQEFSSVPAPKPAQETVAKGHRFSGFAEVPHCLIAWFYCSCSACRVAAGKRSVRPMKLVRRWSWEHTWATFHLSGCFSLLAHYPSTWLPGIFNVLRRVSVRTYLWVLAGWMGWGYWGGLIRPRHGQFGEMALGYPIICLISSVGALIHSLILFPKTLRTIKGMVTSCGEGALGHRGHQSSARLAGRARQLPATDKSKFVSVRVGCRGSAIDNMAGILS